MKILITGANGFLGKNLYKKLINLRHNVDLFDISLKVETDNISFSFNNFKNRSYDIVFHLASFIPYGKFDRFDFKYIEVNLELTREICDSFKDSKIIFASSVSVYGKPLEIITENSPFNNPDFYGMSKLLGEFIVQGHSNFAILRFSSLYGVGMNTKTFIPQIIKNAISTKTITIFGDGSRKQDYLHISEAVDYCINAMYIKENNIFLAVKNVAISNLEVAQEVCKHTEANLQFDGTDLNPSFLYNNIKTQTKLNYQPNIDFSSSISELVAHYKTISHI